MKRLGFWFLPLFAALSFGALFAYGFYLGITGKGGAEVREKGVVAATQPAAKLSRIVILGDSLARGTGDTSGLGIGGNLDAELKRRQLQMKPTVNIAVDGARTADLLKTMEQPSVRRLLGESSVIVISIGGNDFFGSVTGQRQMVPPAQREKVMGDVRSRVRQIIDVARSSCGDCRIFFVGLYNPFVNSPMSRMTTEGVNVWNAELLEEFKGDPNITLVQTSDLFSHRDRLSADRFHPGSEGYRLIARRIAESL